MDNVPVSRYKFKENLLFHPERKTAILIEFTSEKACYSPFSFCFSSRRIWHNHSFQLFPSLLTWSVQTSKQTRRDSASGSKWVRTWRRDCLLSIHLSAPTGDSNAIYTLLWTTQHSTTSLLQSWWTVLGVVPDWPPCCTPAGLGKVSSLTLFQWPQLLSFLLHLCMSVILLQIQLCHVGCHGSLCFSDYSSAAIFDSQEECHVLEYWEWSDPCFRSTI